MLNDFTHEEVVAITANPEIVKFMTETPANWTIGEIRKAVREKFFTQLATGAGGIKTAEAETLLKELLSPDVGWSGDASCVSAEVAARAASFISSQQERVETAERRRDEWKSLFDECAVARDASGFLGTVPQCIEHWCALSIAAEARVKVLEAALKFYADEENWFDAVIVGDDVIRTKGLPASPSSFENPCARMPDCGAIARAALSSAPAGEDAIAKAVGERS